ncbi:MAG: GatB/YqeY domain-containing protein [Lachnospiraceae bacterium]
MSKIDEIRAAMVQAMKEKDKERKDTLSMLLAALKNKAIDKRADLTEEEENEVIKKEIRQTKETRDCAPADRTDIIEQCDARLAVLEEFAPEEMSEDAIHAAITGVIAKLGIETPTVKDKGKIMKELMPLVKGKADGSLVNKIVSEILQ